jgi:hypothetical protein
LVLFIPLFVIGMEMAREAGAASTILQRKPFSAADFEAFINERHRTLLDAIESLLIKERLDLSPQVRELDERVEAIEPAIRDRISFHTGKRPEAVATPRATKG